MWRRDVEDTIDSCYESGAPIDLYIMGYEDPHYPVPVRRNRDIDSKYWYWLFLTTMELRLRSD